MLDLDDNTASYLNASLAADARDLARLCKRDLAGGTSAAQLAETILPTVARRLGDEWMDDRRSFGEVALAASRLQDLYPLFETDLPPMDYHGVVVTCPAGEQHLLGPRALVSFMRRRGFPTTFAIGATTQAIVDTVAESAPRCILVSAGIPQSLSTLSDFIARLRAVAGGATIVLGGLIAREDPDRAGHLDVDCVTSDPYDAISICLAYERAAS